ncbi:MAG TPA: type II secretion system protein [Verrucomicrobiae bacterium]|jgi:prepilin-type N-terminal cleavage/methylation domain-containing protein|nr:type II secretion system protein [Verrucomicrobiae bacterium]
MNSRSSSAGFSLIEVTVAILILGVALVAFTRGITTALASNKDAELQTVAALAAAAQIETMRADATWSDGVTDGDCGSDLPDYHWTQTIKPADVDGLHEVVVTVQKGDSPTPLYTLTTQLFDTDYPTSNESDAKRERARLKRKHQQPQ